MREISVEELARWQREQSDFVLLDVREPHEIAAASIPGALHLPMREVPARLHELDPARRTVVICHHGGRSESIARYLAGRGFVEVYTVEGGIDAYARRIDSKIPTY